MDTQITERLQKMLVADQDLSLAEAALLLAKDEYPGLDVDAYLARLYELATRVRVRLPEGANIEDTLDVSFAQRQIERFREALAILKDATTKSDT